MTVADQIEALERRGWEALSGTSGADFYRENMADDCLMLFPNMIPHRDGDAEYRA